MTFTRLLLMQQTNYIGRNCPLTLRVLVSGNYVIICGKCDTAFLETAFREHIGYTGEWKCPVCGNQATSDPFIKDSNKVAKSPVSPTELVQVEQPPLAWLVEDDRYQPGHEHRLQRRVRLGRDPTRCDIVFTDAKVSGVHACIRFEQGHFVLYDLASTNGTFVNDQQTQKQILQDGDTIRLGPDTRLKFVWVEPA